MRRRPPARMLVIGSPQAQALVEELAPMLRSTPPDAAAIDPLEPVGGLHAISR